MKTDMEDLEMEKQAAVMHADGLSCRAIAAKLGCGKTKVADMVARAAKRAEEAAKQQKKADVKAARAGKTAKPTDKAAKFADKTLGDADKADDGAGKTEDAEITIARLAHSLELKKLKAEEADKIRRHEASRMDFEGLRKQVKSLETENAKLRAAKQAGAPALESELEDALRALYVYGCEEALEYEGQNLSAATAKTQAANMRFFCGFFYKGSHGARLCREESRVLDSLAGAFESCAEKAGWWGAVFSLPPDTAQAVRDVVKAG